MVIIGRWMGLFSFSGCNTREGSKFQRCAIEAAGLNKDLYDTHSFRSGCATDLSKMGIPVEDIKKIGRWRSNSVYEYFK